jgi:outer membrane protein assembly factor BamB
MKEISILLLIACVLVGMGSALAQPQPGSPWPMIHHDHYHTGRSQFNFPDASTLKWSFEIVREIRSSPAIDADGTIYIQSLDGYLFAINPNGTEKWRFSMPGIESSPAIGLDGTIYVGNSLFIYAINPDGSEKWTYDTGALTWSSPTIGQDGRIYVSAYGNGTLYALNPDGIEEWTHSLGGIEWLYESPSIGTDGTIYIRSNDGNVYAYTPWGDLWWQYFVGSGGGGYRGRTSFSVEDSALYTGGRDLFALTPDGNLKWTFPTGGDIYAAPAIGEDGTVYFGSTDSTFYALYPNGNLKWSFRAIGQIVSSAVIDSDGTIFFGAGDRFTDSASVYALNPDGSLLWSYEGLPATIYSTPAIGEDGTLYIACFDGKLYAFGTPTTGAEEREQLKVVQNKLFQNHPNPYFAKDKGTIIPYSLSKPGKVTLKIYDLTGRLVKTLVEGEKEAGFYSINWNSRDLHGNNLASGVYFYHLKSSDFTATKKLILIK